MICIAVGIGAVALLAVSSRRKQKELMRVQKLKGSPFYRELSPYVRYVRHRALDQILIERDQIIFKGMNPPEVLCRFSLSDRHMRFMDKGKLWSMVQLLSNEIPDLRDPKRYRLRSYKVTRANGEKDKAWEYIARAGYKSYVLRTLQWRAAGRDE
ncbi:MAG: hypothetical protein CW338_00250 [Clostridiales bacterium]|nr:hypothetical protein [Clostridiales bacterium]